MRASRGMGAVSPGKMPTAKRKARRDDTDFTQYAAGGKVYKAVKSSALNYNKNRKSKKGFIYSDLKTQAKR